MEFNLEKAKGIGLKEPKKKADEYDADQLALGIEVEKEIIGDEEVAAIIAALRLDKIPDYYTRLKDMEEAATAKKPKGFEDKLVAALEEPESKEEKPKIEPDQSPPPSNP